MKIQALSVENFKALRGKHKWELPDGIIGVVGANGQGKSNFTRAIAWALYGPLIYEKGLNSADTISWGEKSAEVILNFQLEDGDDYGIARTQSPSGSQAELWHITSGNQIAYGSEAVTNTVAGLIGIDRVGFLASVFSRQKDLEGLASLSGPDRTKTVLRLRGLDQVTRAIDAVSKEGSESKKALASVRSILPNARPISEYDAEIKQTLDKVNEAATELDRLKSRKRELQQEVDNLVEEQSALAPKRKAYLDYVSKESSARTNLQQAIDALEKAEALAADDRPEKPKPPAVTFNEKRYRSLTGKQSEDREFIRTLNTTLAAKESCPTCMRPYDNAEELAAAKAAAQKAHASTTKAIEKRQIEIDALEAQAVAQDEYTEALSSWSTAESLWQSRREAVEAAEKALEDARALLEALTPVEDASDDYDRLSGLLRTKQADALAIHGSAAAKESEIDRLNEKVERLQADRALAKESLAKVGKIEKQALEYEVGGHLLKEFKKMQTASLIPDITQRASDFVTQLTDGKYSELVLTPEWDIQYRYEDGELKSFANLSVGERNVFALSLRLALADMQASRIGLLVLDEVLDALDEDRQQLAWSMVESLLVRYNQIFMVTHVPAFKERAPHLIQL